MYFKEREEFIMYTKIKTLEGWMEFTDLTGKSSIYEYINNSCFYSIVRRSLYT